MEGGGGEEGGGGWGMGDGERMGGKGGKVERGMEGILSLLGRAYQISNDICSATSSPQHTHCIAS